MKKTLAIAAILAIIICGIGAFVNYRTYKEDHRLKWSVKNHGGEITIESGFGIQAVHIYAMNPEESNSHKISFSIISFIVSFLAVFAIVFLICLLIRYLLNATGKK